MPIPLGVLAVAGAGGGGGAAGAFELLETQTIGSGGQTSVTFSNLNSTYGSTYQHLQIRMTGATNRADWLDWLYLQFNSDTGSNYATHRLFAEGSTLSSSAFTSQTSIVRAFYVKGANGPASSFGAGIMDILDPFETTKNTTTRVLTGYLDGSPASETIVAFMSGLWNNTAAVTTIKLESLNSATLLEGSRFSLYGMRSS